IVLAIFPDLPRQLQLGARVEVAIGGIAPQPVPEHQHPVDLRTTRVKACRWISASGPLNIRSSSRAPRSRYGPSRSSRAITRPCPPARAPPHRAPRNPDSPHPAPDIDREAGHLALLVPQKGDDAQVGGFLHMSKFVTDGRVEHLPPPAVDAQPQSPVADGQPI